jgi:hypothetical protein
MLGLVTAALAAAAPSPAPVTEMVTISRISVPRWVVASGQGFIFAQQLPHGYVARDSVPGRGTSLYLAINRDHYEHDWYTADGKRVRWRVRAYADGRPGRLLHDIATGPTYEEWADSHGRVHRKAITESGVRNRMPLTPLAAFADARKHGVARPAGRGRYVDGPIVWLTDPRTGRLREERVTERGTRDGRRYVARQRIRILAVRRATRTTLRVARGG